MLFFGNLKGIQRIWNHSCIVRKSTKFQPWTSECFKSNVVVTIKGHQMQKMHNIFPIPILNSPCCEQLSANYGKQKLNIIQHCTGKKLDLSHQGNWQNLSPCGQFGKYLLMFHCDCTKYRKIYTESVSVFSKITAPLMNNNLSITNSLSPKDNEANYTAHGPWTKQWQVELIKEVFTSNRDTRHCLEHILDKSSRNIF